MLKNVPTACYLFFAAVPSLAQSESVSTSRLGPVSNEVAPQVARTYLDSGPGVGLSIGVLENGNTYFFDFGSTQKNANLAPTKTTVYKIGSIGKTFTGLLLARAVVEDKVKLEDDVRKYLEGEYPNVEFEGEPVRLVHLANMTSGLPDNIPDMSEIRKTTSPEEISTKMKQILDRYTKQNFLDDLHKIKVSEKPGVNPSHSNAAAQLLSYVPERVYGASYEELVAKYIEMPLGMSKGAVPAVSVLAKGYNDKGSEMPSMSIKSVLAAGGLSYSTTDMLKYIAHQLDETDPAVALSHRASWYTLDQQQSISFFWIMSKSEHGRRLRYSGGTFGFSSFCDIYPDEKFGVVLLANNSDDTAQGRLQAAAEKIVETIRERR